MPTSLGSSSASIADAPGVSATYGVLEKNMLLTEISEFVARQSHGTVQHVYASRRWMRIVVAAMLALIVVEPLCHAQVRVDRRATKLLRTMQKAQSTSKWFVWALDTMAALRGGDVLPAPPTLFTPSEIELNLQSTLMDVKDFATPIFAAPLPQVGTLPTQSHETRVYLRARVQIALATQDEISDVVQYAPMLTALASEARVSQRLVRSVSEILERVIEAGFDLKGNITYQWFANEAVYMPLLNAIESAANAKSKSIDAIVRARANHIRVAVQSLSGALAAESAALSFEAARLEAVATELKSRLQSIQADERRVEELVRQIRASEEELADLREEVGQLSSEQAEVERQLAQVEQQIRSLDSSLAQSYNLCPNRHSYSSCTHTDYKKTWDAQRAEVSTQRAAAVSSQQSYRQELSRVKARLAHVKQRRDELSDDIWAMRNRLTEARASVVARRKAYDSDFAAATWDLWRSRALLYTEESHQDAAALAVLMQSLPKP